MQRILLQDNPVPCLGSSLPGIVPCLGSSRMYIPAISYIISACNPSIQWLHKLSCQGLISGIEKSKQKWLDFSSSRIDRPPPQKNGHWVLILPLYQWSLIFFYSFFDVLEPPDYFLNEKNCFEKEKINFFFRFFFCENFFRNNFFLLENDQEVLKRRKNYKKNQWPLI